VHPVRVQPETLLLTINGVANASSAGPRTSALLARARKPKRSYGVGARMVRLRFTGGTPPTGYSGDDVTVPVMTPAAFASYEPGETGTYLGTPVEVVSRIAESFR
jgi:hypothetical protein